MAIFKKENKLPQALPTKLGGGLNLMGNVDASTRFVCATYPYVQLKRDFFT